MGVRALHSGPCWHLCLLVLLLAYLSGSPDRLDQALVSAQYMPTNIANQRAYDFGMLIDAGSTGSRIYVYKWPTRKFYTVVPPWSDPVSQAGWSKRTHAPLASFADVLDQIPDNLRSLVEFAKQVLQGHEVDFYRFPIFLKATAGMRMMPASDRENVMSAARAYLGTFEK